MKRPPSSAPGFADSEQAPLPATAARRPSLRSRLLRHVMGPLLLTWALGSGVALGISSYFTQRAFDRSMLDDALLLAAHLKGQQGQLQLQISDSDLRTVLYDQSEQVFFTVLDARQQLVAGHTGLRLPARYDASDGEVQFVDLRFEGRDLRAVVLARQQPAPVHIIVALTTSSRKALLNQLVLFSVIPQALLLLALALWLRRVIRDDLQPLKRLRQQLGQRDAADLAPLPAGLLEQAGSRDVQGLSEAIDALLARVAAGVAAQREFAGNVAHELKTPLAGVRAAAEYGLSQQQPAQWREQLMAVLLSQQRASHLVDQLLALALANEAGSAVPLQRLRLDELVRELLLRYLPLADRAGMALGASGLDEPVWVRADRALLEGLLGNLLDNALRYGRMGVAEGAAPRALPSPLSPLSVDLQRVAGEIWLSVSDQGPGIPVTQRQGLMHRWQQGPAAHQLGEGAGLGLSIVRRYADLMHARLVLDEGADGRGLRASVVFSALD
ncbi:sensor histidine kinase [Paucibacter sp. APW11]|uniref:histidine kinase n=1 Tax=Roseateles aquae TaxID=3077235 RepID=A0ABU3PI27_9BURK|nr:sensor histidine kinase [Paucibacter sp. APW11]MDT9002022.1 sensor histidine kinase [Paucibacter sp. APW11]